MDGEAIRKHMLDAHGIVVEGQMTRYVERRLSADGTAEFHVIGGDARTGVPVRKVVDAAGFRSLRNAPPTE
jgi:hypothetical protein